MTSFESGLNYSRAVLYVVLFRLTCKFAVTVSYSSRPVNSGFCSPWNTCMNHDEWTKRVHINWHHLTIYRLTVTGIVGLLWFRDLNELWTQCQANRGCQKRVIAARRRKNYPAWVLRVPENRVLKPMTAIQPFKWWGVSGQSFPQPTPLCTFHGKRVFFVFSSLPFAIKIACDWWCFGGEWVVFRVPVQRRTTSGRDLCVFSSLWVVNSFFDVVVAHLRE